MQNVSVFSRKMENAFKKLKYTHKKKNQNKGAAFISLLCY